MKHSRLLLILLFTGMVICASYLYYKYKIPHQQSFATMEVRDFSGREMRLNAMGNKALFVNFYATWCGPCLAEMPAIFHAAELLERDSIQFVCITDEPPLRWERLQVVYGTRILFLQSSKTHQENQIFTYPTTYIVDKAGRVSYQKTDPAKWDSREMIELMTRLSKE